MKALGLMVMSAGAIFAAGFVLQAIDTGRTGPALVADLVECGQLIALGLIVRCLSGRTVLSIGPRAPTLGSRARRGACPDTGKCQSAIRMPLDFPRVRDGERPGT